MTDRVYQGRDCEALAHLRSGLQDHRHTDRTLASL